MDEILNSVDNINITIKICSPTVNCIYKGHKFRVANEIPIEYFKSNSPDCSRYSFNYQKEIKIEITPNITEVYLDGLEIIKYYPAEISSLFLLNEQTTIVYYSPIIIKRISRNMRMILRVERKKNMLTLTYIQI